MFVNLVNIQIVTDTHSITYVETVTGPVYFHDSAIKYVICLSTCYLCVY